MRPVVVWENMGTETASTRQTMPKTRMPFDRECITTSKSSKRMELDFGRTPATAFDLEIKDRRFEDIALTWPTRQVVLWSDRKTAARRRLLVEAVTIGCSYQTKRKKLAWR